MKTVRTATITMPELLKFLKEKLDIRAEAETISCEFVLSREQFSHDAIKLTWTEGVGTDDRGGWADR
jgi:hypothetical protein